MYNIDNNIIDSIIDNIFDLFDTAMHKKDEAGINLSIKLCTALTTQLHTDVIISILTITLPIRSFESREEFAVEAAKVVTQREPDDAPAILSGLI